MKKLAWLAAILLAACGDDIVRDQPDAPDPDASPDTSNPFVPPTPFAVPLSVAGPDQLQSATPAPGGGFYAAGFAATGAATPKLVTVVKLTTTGVDPAFGTAGVASTAVEFRGSSDELDIITQADGKILVSATVANAVTAADRDIAVLRFNTDGTLDTTFGIAGIATVNLNDAIQGTTGLTALDGARSIAVDANGIYVHAVSRGLGDKAGGGPRTDTDFTVVRLTSAGIVDATFATAGQFRLDIQEANATPRMIKTLADGTLLVGGYASTPGVGTTPQPVLFKLSAAGTIDTGWSTGGVFHEVVLPAQTEVYNVAIHGTHFVTAGYGRASGDINDYISLRFDLATGERDLTWGGTANGAVVFDPSGAMLGSNCRNAIALPDGKTALIGSTGPSNLPAQDAVVAFLDATGRLDTAYGDGVHVFPLGANVGDQFWGGAVAGDSVLFVGYKAVGATQSDTVNDDSYAVVFTLQ